jgi:putative ABC transport system permease protein
VNTIYLSLRMLRRDWRAGELGLLFIALIVAVTSITSVGFFTDRIAQVLQRQANELLGADLVAVSSQPLPTHLSQTADRIGLRSARTMSFLSMVQGKENNQLTEIKAVSPNYPLRGQVHVATRAFAQAEVTKAIPEPGDAWLDAQLMNQLRLSVGDPVSVGELQLTVTQVLVQEPDRGGDFFSIAPHLLMNLEDVPGTQLIQVGSRVSHRLLLAGEPEQVLAYRDETEQHLKPGESFQGVEDARPEVRAALSRAQQFLGLAAFVSVLLACVAVASSARRFTLRHLDTCAILRCLGAAQAQIIRLYFSQLFCLGLLASLTGCVLGYLAQEFLVDVLGGLLATELPSPSLRPVAFGLLVGGVTLLGFALPPLLALKEVPALRVLRRELGQSKPQSVTAYATGLLALLGLMLWQVGDLKLGFYLLLGALGVTLLLAVIAVALLRLVSLVRARGAAWRFGFANITRRPGASVTQMMALGLGIMALLLLTLVRSDLLASWDNSLPPEAPNRFIINIQSDQVNALQNFFAVQKISTPELYPTVRARLVKINGRASALDNYQDERAQRLIDREFNLSWARDLPSENQITTGQWWGGTDEKLFSVEEGIAETLGIKHGDSLTYSVAGEEFSGTVASLRKVDWDSLRVNFFVIATPQLLQKYPASYITSLYVPEKRSDLLHKLVRVFPNVTVIDVAAILTQVRDIIGRVTLAVEYVFVFTVVAGLLVLYAAIQSTQDERRHESAVLRALGASQRQLLQGLLAEFALLGLLSGLIASLSASLVAYVLATQIFHLPYHFNPWLVLTGAMLGVIGTGLVSALGLRAVLRSPPLQTLREV